MTFLNLPPSLDWPAQFCASSTAATWIVSIVTSNVSQVDRLWTFLPTIYTAYYALLPLLPHEQTFFLFPYAPKALGWSTATEFSPRALLMFGLIFIWMCRLSYNTYRRGLFNLKDEDYRWAVLRSQLPPWLFQVTNLTFIAAIQNVLLLLLGLPTLVAARQPHAPLATSDYTLAGIALILLTVEFTADNQQYAFQSYKYASLAKGKGNGKVAPYDAKKEWLGARLSWTPDDARRGFITRGLWRYSRHPNFFCEQSFWWVITLFPLLAPPPPHLPSQSDFPPLKTIIFTYQHPDLYQPLFESLRAALQPTLLNLLPAISLSALFFSSTLFTEAITTKKYPQAYPAYQKRVGMFAPGQTLLKFIWLSLFGGGTERAELTRLIWGKVGASDKTE